MNMTIKKMTFGTLLIGAGFLCISMQASAQPVGSSAPESFATTRVHINEPREFSYFVRTESEFPQEDPSSQNFIPGVIFGYPSRLQLAMRFIVSREERSTFFDGFYSEVGFAFGKYGAVPLNPVAIFGISIEGFDPNALRGMIQLSGILNRRWVWAANIALESTVGGYREREFLLNSGLRREISPGNLAVGGELKEVYAISDNPDAGPPHESLIGPSIVWHVNPICTLRANSLWGISSSSPRNETNFFLEFELD